MLKLNATFLLGLLATVALGQKTLPDLAPSVRSLFPLGGRPGQAVEIRISGRNLDGALDITFARPDIQAQVISADFFNIKAAITVGPKVPVGLHDYRLRTPRGTYVGVFHVGSLPQQREVEPNNDLAHAQRITLPVLIDGVVTAGDYDVFRFHTEAGDSLIFDLMATRAGSRLDATLGILDERGNELDFIDDYYIHKDPYLAFPVKKTGDYFVRVAATGEGGSPYSSYRLVAGAVPHMFRVLPVGAQRGATGLFRVSGLNLKGVDKVVLGDSLAQGTVVDSAPDSFTFRLPVPASVEPGRYLLHAFAGALEAPLPIPLLVSDLAERLSGEARKRSNPEPIQLPVAISGILDRPRAANFFRFSVSAGERLTFDVDAMKLGYLIDPVIAVYSSDQRLVAFDDDRLQQNGSQPPNLDPYLVHKFENAGSYVAMLRDSAERGDSNYVYRVAVYPVQPDFDLKALTPALSLYRGKTGSLPVRVRRLGGWNTPIEVWAEDLPPGVTCEKKIAEPKDTIVKDNCALNRKLDGTNVDLPIQVAADAPPGFYPLRLRARGVMDGRVVEHGAEILYLWESVGKITGPIAEQKLVATVTDLPDVVLNPPETFSLRAGKTGRLRVLVSRFDGGKTALTIEPDPLIPGVKFENSVLQPGASQVELRITASKEVKPGPMKLRAGAAVSPPIELKLENAREEER